MVKPKPDISLATKTGHFHLLTTYSIRVLEPGKEYSWKVIAEDGKGGISESETHRFKLK